MARRLKDMIVQDLDRRFGDVSHAVMVDFSRLNAEDNRTCREVLREAPAKINVFLRVLGARADGYHDLESLVVPISLADVVTVREADALRVDVRGPARVAGEVPTGGLNLALVAALAIGDACPDAGGAEIVIDKRIPVAGGLGGGSADAAATLLALNELWGCDLDLATLVDIAERIGSDVPVMLAGGPALMSGRGELVAPASVAPLWWALVHFEFGVRSPDAYRWWDEAGGATGPAGRGLRGPPGLAGSLKGAPRQRMRPSSGCESSTK